MAVPLFKSENYLSDKRTLEWRISMCLSLGLSYFATDVQSVSLSVLALSPSGTHDQILSVGKTVAVFLS
jgi:hypothetical protein